MGKMLIENVVPNTRHSKQIGLQLKNGEYVKLVLKNMESRSVHVLYSLYNI